MLPELYQGQPKIALLLFLMLINVPHALPDITFQVLLLVH